MSINSFAALEGSAIGESFSRNSGPCKGRSVGTSGVALWSGKPMARSPNARMHFVHNAMNAWKSTPFAAPHA
jgi:hypothetical protein